MDSSRGAASTLVLTVGLPGTGKTTAARRIEADRPALRLTKDEWVRALHGSDHDVPGHDVIEGRLVEIALRVLELGVDVVLDLDPAEQRRRLDRRQEEAPDTTWPMTDADLSEWAAVFEPPTAGELDGSEPLDDPPPGCATWTNGVADAGPRR